MRILCVAGILALCSCTNFHVVEEGRFYRTGQMSVEQFRETIEKYEIQTVMRLNGGGPSYLETYQPVVEYGLDFVHLPLSANRYPRKDELLGLWEAFETIEYPVLVHCRAGADRTGMASTIYVLQTTGDYDEAWGQLDFFPYLHLGWFGTDAIDEVFKMYKPFHGQMSFPDWVRNEYSYPGMPETDR